MTEPRHRRRPPGTDDKRRRRVVIDEGRSTARRLDRAARAEAGRQRRRRITGAALAAIALVGLAVGVTLWRLPSDQPASLQPTVPADTGAAALYVVRDEAGRGASTALAVSHPTAADRLVLFPPGLVTIVPGFNEREIADAVSFGGAELAELTVTNLLGTRIDAVIDLTPEELAAILPASLSIELEAPLVVSDGGGEVVAVPAGKSTQTPESVVNLLITQGVGDQLGWLQRQGAVWRSLLAAAPESPQLFAGLTTVDRGDPELATAALAGAGTDPNLALTGLEVSRIGVPGPGVKEVYQLSGEVINAFLDTQVRFLRLREGERPRLEILNGNGEIGTTQPVAALLIRAGYRVVRTDNAENTNYDTTEVIAQGLDHQQDALDIQGLLGKGAVLVDSRQPSTVVDVTIIVGRDIPA